MKKLLLAMTCLVCFSSFALADTVDDAISWMYDNGLTIHNNKADFKATKWLRRDEAAKFYVNFAKLLGNTEYVKTASQCTFSDINNSRSDLKDIVVESCRLWLFQGSNGKFNPTKQLTNAQAITVLVRLLAGNQSEVGLSHRANNYYTKANELGILTSVSMNSKDSTATRGNVGVIIWNGKDSKWSPTDQISKYENIEYICSLEDGFYKDSNKQIKFYYWPNIQSQNIYKTDWFLYFLWSIPAEDETKEIHLYQYNCQDNQTDDIHNFWRQIYAMANLNFINENKLYIYEYVGDSCDVLFWKNSIYDITNKTINAFDFENFEWFQKKSWCFCTKNLDIKSWNEVYANCYCWIDWCPDGEPSYKIKIDIMNNKIIQ